MELNEENFNLLIHSVSELAEVLGENQFETKSISLLFLQMNFGENAFEKILTAFSRYVSNKTSEEIQYKDLKSIIDKHIPKDKSITPIVKYQIISGFANNYLPELIPIVEEMKSDIGLMINEELDN